MRLTIFVSHRLQPEGIEAEVGAPPPFKFLAKPRLTLHFILLEREREDEEELCLIIHACDEGPEHGVEGGDAVAELRLAEEKQLKHSALRSGKLIANPAIDLSERVIEHTLVDAIRLPVQVTDALVSVDEIRRDPANVEPLVQNVVAVSTGYEGRVLLLLDGHLFRRIIEYSVLLTVLSFVIALHFFFDHHLQGLAHGRHTIEG